MANQRIVINNKISEGRVETKKYINLKINKQASLKKLRNFMVGEIEKRT